MQVVTTQLLEAKECWGTIQAVAVKSEADCLLGLCLANCSVFISFSDLFVRDLESENMKTSKELCFVVHFQQVPRQWCLWAAADRVRFLAYLNFVTWVSCFCQTVKKIHYFLATSKFGGRMFNFFAAAFRCITSPLPALVLSSHESDLPK